MCSAHQQSLVKQKYYLHNYNFFKSPFGEYVFIIYLILIYVFFFIQTQVFNVKPCFLIRPIK